MIGNMRDWNLTHPPAGEDGVPFPVEVPGDVQERRHGAAESPPDLLGAADERLAVSARVFLRSLQVAQSALQRMELLI